MINELIDFDKDKKPLFKPIVIMTHGLNYVFISVNKGSCVLIKIL